MTFAGAIWAALRGKRSTAHHQAKKDFNVATQFFKSPPVGSPDWLFATIERAKDRPLMEVIELTPALAKTLLLENFDNRSIRATKLAQYSADMAAGRWSLNGEPIIIARDGKLNDGQHRCLAAIDSNTAIPTMIVFGVDRESRLTVDQGGARSAGDFLNMEGVTNASLVAAIGRMAIAFERNDGASLAGSTQVTSAEVRERADADPLLSEAAKFGHTNQKYSSKFLAGSQIGFAFYVLAKVNREAATDFLGRVCRNDGLGIGTAMHTLHEKLREAGRIPRDRKLALIFKAWNFHRRGAKRVAKTSLNTNLPFPSLI